MKIKDLKDLDDLLPEKVKLLIGDEAKYQEIALLVDRPDFLKTVRELRDKLEIEAPLVDIYENIGELFADGWKKTYKDWSSKNPQKNKALNFTVKRIIRNLKLSLYLRNTIIQAILFKTVIDYSGIVKVLGKSTRFKNTTIGILPTPHTTYPEIKRALKRTKELFKLVSHSYSQKKPAKFSSNTERNRYFYWERISGKKYTVIATNWGKLHPNEDYTTETHVIKGVKTYTKLLNLS